MIEIERKFLLKTHDFKAAAFQQHRICQGYLNSNPERAVRIRTKGTQGFITVKGLGNSAGSSRLEWEKEISMEEAQALLPLCEAGVIDKTRFEVKVGKHIFEVDEFYGENQGLVLAEVELGSENEAFEKPDWLGEEVTHDYRYYNAYLCKNPFAKWGFTY